MEDLRVDRSLAGCGTDECCHLRYRVKGTHGDKHGQLEEHLREELADGWKVKSLFGFGGAADLNARGWITVLLEKGD